ncbi:MFS transporter [Streptomyces koyangensis]|uniref:MFS transporter n=1 Tax=Streptomyces koyangensis TaxID=188770 RepID=UPI003C2EAC4C
MTADALAPPRDRRPLTLALTANTVSITGNALTLIGVPWFVLQTTGSATRAGVVALCATLPVIVSALFGGPLIDRIGRRRASILSDLVCAAAVGAIPLLHHLNALPFWLLCALMGISGLFHAPGETSRSSLLPALAARARTPMTRAASLYDGVSRGARMLGAALGGVLIAVLGPTSVLVLDAATFGVSALLMAYGFRHVPEAQPLPRTARTGSYRAELAEGYRYLARTPLLLAICAVVMMTNGLDQGWSAVLLPSFASTHLGGAAQLGLLSALWGAGALTGTFLYAAFGHRLPRWPVFTACFLLIGAPRFATAAFTDTALPLAVLLPLTGLGAGALNPILSTVTFETVPERLRTRVLGATTAAVLLTTPLGGLFAGLLTDHLGLRTAFLVVGTGYFLATLSPLVFPVWRTMDRTGLPAPATAERKPVDTPAPAGSDGAP